jgi:MFS family permease
LLRHFAEGAFGSKHLNLLNLHVGIANFGQVLRMQINVVFFASMGLPAEQIFLLMAVLVGTRFIYRTPLMLVAHRFGGKASLIIGQLILSLAFGLYLVVDGAGPLLWLAIGLMSVGEALYWLSVHSTFAVLSEHGKFARQHAARSIFMAIGGLLAPVVAALLAGENGWQLLFLVALLGVVISIIPLLAIPEPCPAQPIGWRKGFRVSKAGMKLFLGTSVHAACMFYIWPLIIFLQFGSIEKFGFILAATMLISFLLMIYVSRRIDMGHGKWIVVIGPLLYGAVMMALAGLGRDVMSIIILTACLDLAHTLYRHPYGAAVYRWAKAAQNPMWYCYWLEFGWDIGTGLTMLLAAGIIYFNPGLDLRWLMLLALPGIAWCYIVYINDGNFFSRDRKAMT